MSLLNVKVGGKNTLLKFEKKDSVKIGGRLYPYIKIGDWLVTSENLDWKYPGLTISPAGVPTSEAAWYYNNDEATYGVNGNKYGLLYNGYAAYYLYSNASTLFPSGWNLLGDNGWYTFLMATVGYSGGLELKSKTDWLNDGNGNDTYGFNAKPAGYRSYDSGSFNGIGNCTYIWQGKDNSDYTGTTLHLVSPYYGNTKSATPYGNNVKQGASIRLFKYVGA